RSPPWRGGGRRASSTSARPGPRTPSTRPGGSSRRKRRSSGSRDRRRSIRSRTSRTCATSSPPCPPVPELSLVVNGEVRTLEVEDRALLVHALRDGLGLTGAHIGCAPSQCGACTVLLDGRAVKSCTVLARQVEGRDVKTIEGLARDGEMHPLQRAFVEHHGLQCGFCTPGVILASADLLSRNGNPSAEEIRHALRGNLCRCTGYQGIVESIHAVGSPS